MFDHTAPENRDSSAYREEQDRINVAQALQNECPHRFGELQDVVDGCRRRQIQLLRGQVLETTTRIDP